MKMRYNDIVKEIPSNLVPTYKSLGWQEIVNKTIVKPIEKVEKLTKGFKDKNVDIDNKVEEE